MVHRTVLDVMGGYYLRGGADITANTRGMNLKSHTTYRSLADGNVFPGHQKAWLVTLGKAGVRMNFVLETKHYGAALGPQTFTVEGRTYTVPAPDGTMQQRGDTTWPRAYTPEQVTSGAIDGLLHRAVFQLKALPFTVNIQCESEVDTNNEFGTTTGRNTTTTADDVTYNWAQSDTRAVDACRYIIGYFRTHGAPAGTTFTIGIGGFDQASFIRVHPASLAATVNFLQWNAYLTSPGHTTLARFRRAWDWTMTNLDPVWRGKQIILAEWGVRSAEFPGAAQAAAIRTADEAVASINALNGPDIVMANYFDSGWGTLSPRPEGLAALREVYGSAPFAD